MHCDSKAIEHLEREGASYELHVYPQEGGPVASKDVAAYFGFPAQRVYKTLVTRDGSGNSFVFCLPSSKRIDNKKAAALVGAHNIQMLDPASFEGLTGYTHGGCSPFGMCTKLPVFVDQDAQSLETLYLNGGKIGYLIEVQPALLISILDAQYAEFTKE